MRLSKSFSSLLLALFFCSLSLTILPIMVKFNKSENFCENKTPRKQSLQTRCGRLTHSSKVEPHQSVRNPVVIEGKTGFRTVKKNTWTKEYPQSCCLYDVLRTLLSLLILARPALSEMKDSVDFTRGYRYAWVEVRKLQVRNEGNSFTCNESSKR